MSNQPAILYVEDDSRSVKVMDVLLTKRMGLSHVTIMEDSANFLERVQTLTPKPDVIFLDIHVEPHNGFAMLKMLRDSGEFDNSRIVALTASVMNEEVVQLRQAGFDACLGKPVDMDTFPDVLNRILNGESLWHIIS